jgi:hypothetical protein
MFLVLLGHCVICSFGYHYVFGFLFLVMLWCSSWSQWSWFCLIDVIYCFFYCHSFNFLLVVVILVFFLVIMVLIPLDCHVLIVVFLNHHGLGVPLVAMVLCYV